MTNKVREKEKKRQHHHRYARARNPFNRLMLVPLTSSLTYPLARMACVLVVVFPLYAYAYSATPCRTYSSRQGIASSVTARLGVDKSRGHRRLTEPVGHTTQTPCWVSSSGAGSRLIVST
jgi:hypothetical protein